MIPEIYINTIDFYLCIKYTIRRNNRISTHKETHVNHMFQIDRKMVRIEIFHLFLMMPTTLKE